MKYLRQFGLILLFSFLGEALRALIPLPVPASIYGMALLFLAFGATALAYAWYVDGVKALGAGAASGYITLVPLFGVLISAWLLGEAIDLPMVVGCAMAIGGTAIMNWGRMRA